MSPYCLVELSTDGTTYITYPTQRESEEEEDFFIAISLGRTRKMKYNVLLLNQNKQTNAK